MSQIQVCVMGAGGKMGTRTSNNLVQRPDLFHVTLVENSPKGIESIRQRGLDVTPESEAIPKADIVVFAVPDTMIRKLSEIYVPMLRTGAGMIILDPAAAVAREIVLRDDCTFGVAHPCHPSYFLDQDTFEARQDRFGGVAGKQDVVVSKIQGDDARFQQMVEVIRQMYSPVMNVYEMTSDQIAFLEPTLVEVLGASCLYAMAETVEKAVEKGIQREAAVSFMTGHIYNLTANFLGYIPGKPPVSDACKVAIAIGNRLVLRDDWKRIWDDDVLNKVIATMLHPDKPQI
ncbi:MAG: F420-dependent NADP oxidoreductase [Eubacteriales bacterium]|nr:F420-dependent NADP oxidoreductase [Eubacteriales bacterium]